MAPATATQGHLLGLLWLGLAVIGARVRVIRRAEHPNIVDNLTSDEKLMSWDIDHIIEGVKKRLPVRVRQHWVKNPAVDDDGIWWFYTSDDRESPK
jgi:hypothetical protein